VNYLKPKFSVAMPTGDVKWPFKPKPERKYCKGCDRPLDACDCEETKA
jgi:hypothetical protein